jgi:hypothetical protein
MKALRCFGFLKKAVLSHKALAFAALIFWSPGSVAQQPLIEPCAGMEGYASVLCHKNIQEQQQQELAQSLSDDKQRRIRDQKMERLGFPSPATAAESQEFARWVSENPWFGADKMKTQFAMQYAKQLRREQPRLLGRMFFDNVAGKVGERFLIGKK